MRGKLMSLINYRYMIGFRANNRQRVIGAFCNFHVNSKRCVMTLITAAKETTNTVVQIRDRSRVKNPTATAT